ncbi:MAG: molybdate ABC transporter substrate-binding protein [Rhodobacterales bacterium]|nr:molybdate ABC transporter substrate-binding protein [Rhodobacterales bacterium]
MNGTRPQTIRLWARTAIAWISPLVLSGCGGTPTARNCADGIDVYAAASLRNVLVPVGERYTATTGISVRHNFAGSGVLAQQILATPGADVYLSANTRWMDEVTNAGRVVEGSLSPWLQNRLVLVARIDAALPHSPQALFHPSVHHIAMGDPNSVPAGQYAKQWLTSLQHQGADGWTQLQQRASHAHDVRAALDHVRSDTGVVGLVYATDAATASDVKVLYEIPPRSLQSIVYPAAQIAPGCAPAANYLAHLRTTESFATLSAHGFIPLDAP